MLKTKGFYRTNGNSWSAKQIILICLELLDSVGGPRGWGLLTERLCRAVICQKAVEVATGNWQPISANGIQLLIIDMHRLLEINGYF